MRDKVTGRRAFLSAASVSNFVVAQNTAHATSPVRLFRVLFEPGKHAVSPRYKRELDFVMLQMTRIQASRIEITGHTDAQEARIYDPALSLRRAHAVRDYFLRNGTDETLISIRAAEATQPIVATSAAEALNRSVEVFLR
jgi:OOP family OmpA-OmpF porin